MHCTREDLSLVIKAILVSLSTPSPLKKVKGEKSLNTKSLQAMKKKKVGLLIDRLPRFPCSLTVEKSLSWYRVSYNGVLTSTRNHGNNAKQKNYMLVFWAKLAKACSLRVACCRYFCGQFCDFYLVLID